MYCPRYQMGGAQIAQRGQLRSCIALDCAALCQFVGDQFGRLAHSLCAVRYCWRKDQNTDTMNASVVTRPMQAVANNRRSRIR